MVLPPSSKAYVEKRVQTPVTQMKIRGRLDRDLGGGGGVCWHFLVRKREGGEREREGGRERERERKGEKREREDRRERGKTEEREGREGEEKNIFE